jgi:hypothetical protein
LLTILAEVAGVTLAGLDDDQLDIVALRLVVESGDQPNLIRIGRIVDEVRHAEEAVDQGADLENAVRSQGPEGEQPDASDPTNHDRVPSA